MAQAWRPGVGLTRAHWPSRTSGLVRPLAWPLGQIDEVAGDVKPGWLGRKSAFASTRCSLSQHRHYRVDHRPSYQAPGRSSWLTLGATRGRSSLTLGALEIGVRPTRRSSSSRVPAGAMCSTTVANGAPTSHASDPRGLLTLSKKFNRFYYGGLLGKECWPLYCQGIQIGLVRPDVLEAIRPFDDVFDFSVEHRCSIQSHLDSFTSRTEAVDRVLRKIRDDCDFVALRGWRNETYDIKPNFAREPLFKMERAATCMFGLRQYGIDINGYVNHSTKGLCLWLQKRAKKKPTWPGMWDNFVSGGLSTGFGIAETAVKEAQEEANVCATLAQTMKPGGTVTFFFQSERGIFPNTEFVFDLELPEDFVPLNNDGEVQEFELLPVPEVFERLTSSEMKTTSCPVTIDFLVRRGIINSENEPNFPQLVENLHIPIHSVYDNRMLV